MINLDRFEPEVIALDSYNKKKKTKNEKKNDLHRKNESFNFFFYFLTLGIIFKKMYNSNGYFKVQKK